MKSPMSNVPDSRVPQSATAMQPAGIPVQPSGAAPHQNDTTTASSQAPGVAVPPGPPITVSDDDAAVEQRWIQKAKEIIARTKNDPFAQSRMLTELRMEYLASRYGKKIEDHKIKL